MFNIFTLIGVALALLDFDDFGINQFGNTTIGEIIFSVYIGIPLILMYSLLVFCGLTVMHLLISKFKNHGNHI